ncbi:MAG TPA: LD-carboxypeptidase [Candidatus Eisenbacteria bacterium]|nr:LD-carboxypeptidase [Candidatus Eisenbacteria bacterium]
MTARAMRHLTAPPRLRPGDRIELVAPSGPVKRTLVLAGARRLEAAGYRVTFGRHVFDRRGHLAGRDEARAGDMNRALRDPDVRCVLMARGGYGAMRAAPEIDWDAMRRDPKIYAGFSDATYFHCGFALRAGVRTLHGPNAQGFGSGSARELARWIAWTATPRPSLAHRTLRAPVRMAGSSRPATGRVLGGNLVLLHYAALTGLLPPLRGSLLFLEEVNEAPYRVDGLLTGLLHAGSLRGLRGIALGGFTNCVPQKGHKELPLRTVLHDHLAGLGIPVRRGVAAGHGARNIPFPLGARAVLDPRAKALVFEEGLVS